MMMSSLLLNIIPVTHQRCLNILTNPTFCCCILSANLQVGACSGLLQKLKILIPLFLKMDLMLFVLKHVVSVK